MRGQFLHATGTQCLKHARKISDFTMRGTHSMRIVTLLVAGVATCGRATAPAAPSLPTPASLSGPLPAVRTAAMDAHLKYLADDLLEGRAPATRGGALAADYTPAQFEALGLEPGGPRGADFPT